MRKAISLFLALLMCLSLCACGGSNDTPETKPSTEPVETTPPTANKATIITNEGNTVELSAEDLFNEYDGNEARFYKLYGDAKIQFSGTVKKIETDCYVYAESNRTVTAQNKIVFEEGWCLIIGEENANFDLADYYPGQKLEITTGIVGAPFNSDFIKDICDNNRVVWLVGNDEMNHTVVNNIITTIKPIE